MVMGLFHLMISSVPRLFVRNTNLVFGTRFEYYDDKTFGLVAGQKSHALRSFVDQREHLW